MRRHSLRTGCTHRTCGIRYQFLGTRFFLANLGTGTVDLLVDATENTHLFWASAAEALRMADTGDIKVIYPTRRNLERLALFDSYNAAVAD